jgi:hypothetical protein
VVPVLFFVIQSIAAHKRNPAAAVEPLTEQPE